MAIKIRKVADIVGNHVALCDAKLGSVAAEVLSTLPPVHDPMSECIWQMDLVIGQGAGAHKVAYPLPPFVGKSHPVDTPAFIGEDRIGRCLFFCQNRLFVSERAAKSLAESDEITLRIKKAVYDEQADISSLRAAVANLEAAVEYQRSGPRRDPIPEDVKLLVWARDGGACVRCGATHGLHFDHIIPVALGGGNTAANIQILCQACNHRKSDKIAVP
jgi:HNH endonuclease